MYLSIDLGDKRCGIALYIEGVVIPKDIVKREKLIPVVKKYIKEYNIITIVVGLPYDLYGKNLRQLEKTEVFIQRTKELLPNIKIEWCDERFTSFEADQTLKDLGIFSTSWEKDDLAAASILESYIHLQKNNQKNRA